MSVAVWSGSLVAWERELASEPGEGGVDLGDFRFPDRFHLLLDHAREVVSGPRLTVEKTEKDVRKGHTKTISTLI